MNSGHVVSIHLTSKGAQPMQSVKEVRACAGQGLEGDRYFTSAGTFSNKKGPDREITLIEREALDSFNGTFGTELKPGDARRNVVTQGISLNDLVGKTFTVGESTLRGLRLCEPCSHLVKLTQLKDLLPGLVGHGGLRAQILTSGTIRVGDPVQEAGSVDRMKEPL